MEKTNKFRRKICRIIHSTTPSFDEAHLHKTFSPDFKFLSFVFGVFLNYNFRILPRALFKWLKKWRHTLKVSQCAEYCKFVYNSPCSDNIRLNLSFVLKFIQTFPWLTCHWDLNVLECPLLALLGATVVHHLISDKNNNSADH